MQIIGINGSPRENSNSERLLDYVFENLKSEWGTKKLNLRDIPILCYGCDECYKDALVHEDYAHVYEAMIEANVIIFSTPTYFGMPSTLLKILMDRTNHLWVKQRLKGKIGVVIANGASRFGGIELNAKNIQHFFHDHDMITLPFAACFNSSINFSDQKYPNPLTDEIKEPLNKLVSDLSELIHIIR